MRNSELYISTPLTTSIEFLFFFFLAWKVLSGFTYLILISMVSLSVVPFQVAFPFLHHLKSTTLNWLNPFVFDPRVLFLINPVDTLWIRQAVNWKLVRSPALNYPGWCCRAGAGLTFTELVRRLVKVVGHLFGIEVFYPHVRCDIKMVFFLLVIVFSENSR